MENQTEKLNKHFPTPDLMIVEPLEKEDFVETQGGLYLPTADDDKGKGYEATVQYGMVVRKGDNVKVQENEIVFFSRHAGSDIIIGGQPYRYMRVEEMLGIHDGLPFGYKKRQ